MNATQWCAAMEIFPGVIVVFVFHRQAPDFAPVTV